MGTLSKRVVLLVRTWQRAGGLEAVTMDIAWAFCELGWRVEVVSVFDGSEGEDTPGVEVTSLYPRGRIRRWLWGRVLWKEAVSTHVRCATAGGGLVLCAHAHLLPALASIPAGSGVHRLGWVYGIDVWGHQAQRWVPFLNQLDDVVSISSFTADQMRRVGLMKPARVVPCCVDTDIFSPTPTPARIRRSEILICGRMSSHERYKGHEVLFESMMIAEKLLNRPLSIRVVGVGDDALRLTELSRKLGIGERVSFVGRLPLPELVEAYRHCGVFCMPSRVDRSATGYWTGEGFGIVYVEAAACGRPVIASSEGGAPETIVPGETGLLADPRSPEKVAAAIARILSDDGRADEMGRKGRQLAVKEFSRERFRKHVQALVATI